MIEAMILKAAECSVSHNNLVKEKFTFLSMWDTLIIGQLQTILFSYKQGITIGTQACKCLHRTAVLESK